MTVAKLTGIYTLTPTHCGTGQASGAIDLPIAKESHTGLPVLPASSLKGAARHALERKITAEELKKLFGSEVADGTAADGEGGTGELVMIEGRLLAYPLRSLQRPFIHATCPLLLERLARDLRALGSGDLLGADWKPPSVEKHVLVSNNTLSSKTLVVEDLVYNSDEVEAIEDNQKQAIGRLLGSLLPQPEQSARDRIRDCLVVMPDNDFLDAVRRATPVQARIRLDENKTTTGPKGNLWYEEHLPSDCLFAVLITQRSGLNSNADPAGDFLNLFKQHYPPGSAIQLGGNETVGQGYCWWTAYEASNGASQGGASRG